MPEAILQHWKMGAYMLSWLLYVISSLTHFTRFLQRSQQSGPPVAYSRSQLYNIFFTQVFLPSMFYSYIMHLCSKGSHSQRYHQHRSVYLKLWETQAKTYLYHTLETTQFHDSQNHHTLMQEGTLYTIYTRGFQIVPLGTTQSHEQLERFLRVHRGNLHLPPPPA